MVPVHMAAMRVLLAEDDETKAYTRYGSDRALYHFHVDNAAVY